MNDSKNDRTVLVTGASRGIGRAIATLLTERGYRVFGTSRHPDEAESAPYRMLQLDVREEASVAQCLSTVGRDIDVLVNNAGYAFVGAVEETAIEDCRAQMETNFFGAFRMINAVLPSMRRRRSGTIVSISSVSGVVPPPFLAAYAASKHALEAVSESLSLEVKPHGLNVAIVELDSMKTGITFALPAKTIDAYATPRTRMLARLEQGSHESGEDPMAVARCVEAILDDPSPRLRWVVGDDVARVTEARKRLPQEAFAELVRRELGLWQT
jgi:NAD(P)-dependent dehydrogenase (short-subunit alcohol dehydrogenase family)